MSFTPDYVIHPGESLLEALTDRSRAQSELSIRTWLTEKHINQIINWKSPITPDTAILLQNALGISMTFWNNLQKSYDETLARLEAEQRIQEELSLLWQFKNCYKELVDKNILISVSTQIEKYTQLINYFGVSSLLRIEKTEAIAYRKSTYKDIDVPTLSAWLRLGIKEISATQLPEYDEKKLKQGIIKLRSLVSKPWSFWEDIKNTLHECGVGVVFSPYFSRTYVNWATRWIWKNPLIQVSIRGKSHDGLWFTLFHELWHVLLHGKKDQFIEFENPDYDNNPQEKEANDFASEILIHEEDYQLFIGTKIFDFDSILSFSHKISIDPGIVAWRLAKDWYISRPIANRYRKQIALGK